MLQNNYRFAVIDYECKNWNEVLGLGFFDGKRYILFETTDDFLSFIRNPNENWIIYAHNGGRYDFLFLLDSVLPYKSNVIEYPRKLICINSSVASFQLLGCEFRDSLKILPGSLAKILPFFGYKKQEIDYDNIENEDWESYLENDCRTLHGALTKYFEYLYKHFRVKPALTIASLAMKIYRKNFNKIDCWESHYERICRDAYLGGRCEIFKMSGEGINSYDINSMYPYVMRVKKFPVGKPQMVRRESEYDRFIENECLGIIKATVSCPRTYIPLLPIRYHGKMLFLSGTITGTWTLTEFRAALRAGYSVRRIHFLVRYLRSEKLFSSWIDYVYGIRQASKDEAEKYILKILQNSLYGKFGQKREKEEIVFLSDTDELQQQMVCLSNERGIYKKPKFVNSDFILPHIAAHVTSYARLELFKYLNENSYYCDTDSVFTSDCLPTGNALGEMKLEESNVDARFYYPKVYQTTNKVKAKGFELGRTKEPEKLFSRIVQKEEITLEKMLSFKQCLISKKPFASKRLLTKSIKGRYDKRRVVGNDTEPYTFEEWRKENGLVR